MRKFVLNIVNLLDSYKDLMADMRPKGRGRPQRILLGSWPEDHIRGVIRAVVFRDTGGKDDLTFMYGRVSVSVIVFKYLHYRDMKVENGNEAFER